MEKQLINILTRTCNRPEYFKRLRHSLLNQTYTNWRHIVHTDNENDVNYILKSGVPQDDILISEHLEIDQDKFKTERINAKEYVIRHRPYNLYFEKMHKLVNDGWIIYLDDDDEFVNENSLKQLIALVEKQSEDSFVIFQALFYMRDKFLPWQKLPANKKYKKGKLGDLSFGDLGGICLAFHSSFCQLAVWDEYSGGDYRVYQKLKAQLNLVGLQNVITKVQDGPNGGDTVDYVPTKWYSEALRWASLAKHKLGF